jgi:hypothetical protein
LIDGVSEFLEVKAHDDVHGVIAGHSWWWLIY